MQNFEAIAKSFVSQGGALQVKNAAELEEALARVLADPVLAETLGQNALRVVRENAGAIERTVEMMLEYLEGDVVVRRPMGPQAPQRAAGRPDASHQNA